MATQFSKALAIVALLMFLICATSGARADVVTVQTMDGFTGNFHLTTSGSLATFSFGTGLTTALNGTPVNFPVYLTSIGNLVLNTSGTSVDGGTNYAFANANPILQEITGLPGGSGEAIFHLNNVPGAYAFVPSGLSNS